MKFLLKWPITLGKGKDAAVTAVGRRRIAAVTFGLKNVRCNPPNVKRHRDDRVVNNDHSIMNIGGGGFMLYSKEHLRKFRGIHKHSSSSFPESFFLIYSTLIAWTLTITFKGKAYIFINVCWKCANPTPRGHSAISRLQQVFALWGRRKEGKSWACFNLCNE